MVGIVHEVVSAAITDVARAELLDAKTNAAHAAWHQSRRGFARAALEVKTTATVLKALSSSTCGLRADDPRDTHNQSSIHLATRHLDLGSTSDIVRRFARNADRDSGSMSTNHGGDGGDRMPSSPDRMRSPDVPRARALSRGAAWDDDPFEDEVQC
jgi:hypothetical protein